MEGVRSFLEEVKALEQYGHDCCARIDDKIHECCERIKDAYSNDVVAYQTALSRMEQQEILTTYDVLDNERHKTALALKDCEFTYTKAEDNLEVLLVDGFGICGSTCYLEAFERLRDRLIYLLVGDQNPVKYSLEEDSDGVDAGRCDEADSDCPDALAAERTGDCVGHPDTQGLAPITGELRGAMEHYCTFLYGGMMVRLEEGEFNRLCNAIDAIHAQLERENEELHKHPAWAPESHYMLLPKDADGVPIHVGDVMEWVDIEGTVEVTCTVEAVGVGCFFAWDKANKRFAQKLATSYRHHKSDTWEQIIEDALDGYHDTDFDALVARCKALAGDADE